MKKILLSISTLIVAVTFFSCGNGDRLDELDNSIPAPQPVEVTKVTPIAGGAILTVKIPDDNNLKGVVAVYDRNGEEVNNKISRYIDTLVVEGYADTNPHEVKVYSFNVNEKRSTPVSVTINPLTPAVLGVKFDVIEAFGGVKVHITNNTGLADLAVCLLADKDTTEVNVPNNKKKWTEVQTLFTSSNDIYLARRSLKDVKTIFGVYIRDHWGNISDTISKVLTPWHEEQIDKSKFKDAKLADDNSYSANASYYPLSSLWNGSGTSSIPNFYASDAACPMPQWFTIDLGAKVKLSRIGKMARIDYIIWSSAHPREYEFWGSNNPTGETVPGNEHGFDNSWVKLGYYLQYKPSGYNADGSVGTYTQEDREYFNTGTEFEMDETKYPHAYDAIRYLRVVILSTYATWETKAKVGQFQLGELTPYGQVVEKYR